MSKRKNSIWQNKLGVAFIVALAFAILFFVGNLFGFTQSDERLNGRILLWHSFNEADATVLESILDSFGELNPKVTIQATYISPDTLLDRYQTASDSGLGPDLFLGPSDWVPMLARDGLIRQLMRVESQSPLKVDTQTVDELLERYTPTILTTVTFDNALYALPLSVDTQGLYYNRRMASGEVQTLDDLLQEAEAGRTVLLSTRFVDAFWGVRAFGGQLLEEMPENGGVGKDGAEDVNLVRVVLDRGGFANWLNWLKSARNAQGMILDANHQLLLERFLAGDAAYYVGYAREMGTIRQTLGAENVGVSHLPAGPVGNSGPFLTTEAFFFNPASTPEQRAIAEKLALFVTNAEQSGLLMRNTNRVPANRQTQINPRLNQEIANLAAQIRTSIALPHTAVAQNILALGDQAYQLVLESGAEPAEVALQITQQINEANGLTVGESDDYKCPQIGVMTLWEVVGEAHGAALDELIRRFNHLCPNLIVTRKHVDKEQVLAEFGAQNRSNRRLVLLLAPRSLLTELVALERVRDITGLVDAEEQQQYLPAARDAFHIQGKLYGLPDLLRVNALYYNYSLVETPAQTLNDLIDFASADTGASINTAFREAFWIIPALEGNVRFASDESDEGQASIAKGMFDWLGWLRQASEQPGFFLSADEEALRERFVQGDTAYYVGGPERLAELQKALGTEKLGVTTLPAGPAGEAGPLLDAYGFMFEPEATDAQVLLGLAFSRYATGEAGQSFLATELKLAPANITAEVDEPLLTFVEQSATAVIIEDDRLINALNSIATIAVRLVLEEDAEPASALISAAEILRQADGSALSTDALNELIALWRQTADE